jgi:hypothetical protein
VSSELRQRWEKVRLWCNSCIVFWWHEVRSCESAVGFGSDWLPGALTESGSYIDLSRALLFQNRIIGRILGRNRECTHLYEYERRR